MKQKEDENDHDDNNNDNEMYVPVCGERRESL